jgi:hypothetical protein
MIGTVRNVGYKFVQPPKPNGSRHQVADQGAVTSMS